jgi:hypothetical protein
VVYILLDLFTQWAFLPCWMLPYPVLSFENPMVLSSIINKDSNCQDGSNPHWRADKYVSQVQGFFTNGVPFSILFQNCQANFASPAT